MNAVDAIFSLWEPTASLKYDFTLPHSHSLASGKICYNTYNIYKFVYYL